MNLTIGALRTLMKQVKHGMFAVTRLFSAIFRNCPGSQEKPMYEEALFEQRKVPAYSTLYKSSYWLCSVQDV